MIIAECRLETHTDRGKETLTFEPNKVFRFKKSEKCNNVGWPL